MPHILDTDICSYYLKGLYEKEIGDNISRVGPENIFISRITVAELQVWAYRYRKYEPKVFLKEIDGLVSKFNFVDLDNDIWSFFGQMKARVLAGGLPPGESGDFDILQACVAKAKNLIVVTNNEKHYARLGISIENWTKM